MEHNNFKGGNFFQNPQNGCTSNDGLPPAVNKGTIRKREEDEDIKGQEKIFKLSKFAHGYFKKSLFSSSTRKEILKANFSEKDKNFIEQQKMLRIVDYINAAEMEKKFKNRHFSQTDEVEKEDISVEGDNIILKDFFENHKLCADGVSHCSETCAQIADLFRCWKVCKIKEDLSCPRCCLAVQELLQKKEQCDLRKKKIHERFERLSKLIDNYDEFQGMKLYHDLRNKNLFLSENDNMESYTEEEKNMIRLLKIFRILHHTNCIWRDWVKDCQYPDCQFLEEIMTHAEDCTIQSGCNSASCKEIKNLLSHWDKCVNEKSSNCSICGKFLIRFCKYEEEVLAVEREMEKHVISLKWLTKALAYAFLVRYLASTGG